MLITFTCPAYADITMFGDTAVQLIKLMGHSGNVPGAVLAADISSALERLEYSFEENEQLDILQPISESDEPEVTLSQRAYPFIELLKSADKAQCNVMWGITH